MKTGSLKPIPRSIHTSGHSVLAETAVEGSDSEGSVTASDVDCPRHRFTQEETAMIFDWDDTVLPSTWVQEQGLRLDATAPISSQQQRELSDVARHAATLLSLAKQHGTVILVTNAERGWIELSCRKFLPALYPTLESVKLLSARSLYERPGLPSPSDWKLLAFESEMRRIFKPHTRRNILSFGDSLHEREAVLQATARVPKCTVKSLKFVERPRIEELTRQHRLMTHVLERVVHHNGNLDLF
eukprot:CAMPEP_0194540514 /NCGR_PEP_ID=MMETSP0253-20130528/80736_1 /TAXON_ID=2966 /ORGANISM="Noctiluca scintillans" /LENGTH=242 /DNA_ID=CAMNT_0039386889 /DNA_START=61 /DNA_END=786 /DNA_ORIENTATION=-